MREEFQADLTEVNQMLVSMAKGVRSAMNEATSALLNADSGAAEHVVAHDAEINAIYRTIEDRVYALLARQAPVASDLRIVLTALHVAVDLERMGDLADHVARAALRRHPAVAVPRAVAEVFGEMGQAANQIAERITTALATSDAVLAAELERDDDAMDDLHRKLFEIMFSPAWAEGTPAAVDTALLGRYYERFADHAVNAGSRVVFLVTGQPLDDQ